ncbi:response regulator [Hydrogenophaga sp.]|uniref:response regulator n=1 Tax=Hydrogenophaga sp. TaxID=1904254 RepID=UPI0025BA3AF1|nr:response regulator [Hydrogenophaga sp.]MBT9463014.1 response regulator [Hydrogenophaga sp.]
MHVLLADDDRDSAETLAELLLLAESRQVTIVFDGVELLAAATGIGTHPDVIVTDIEMPRMDGFTAAKRIRSALGAATPLLIAVTGHMGLAKLAALHKVFDHVLLKPFKIQDLVKLLPDL